MEGARGCQQDVVDPTIKSSNYLGVQAVHTLPVDEGVSVPSRRNTSWFFQEWYMTTIDTTNYIPQFVFSEYAGHVLPLHLLHGHVKELPSFIQDKDSVNKPKLN